MKIKVEKKTILIIIFVFALFGIVGVKYFWEKESLSQIEEKPKITVFYSPNCGCCHEYIAYLKRNGFKVKEEATQDILSIKEKYQIPPEMESCHTALVENYFIEGHIPVEIIKKLLQEKPEIDGIALPGMPQGAPGMSGFKTGKLTIYSISKGIPFEFATF